MASGMRLKLSLFGESHGPVVGITIEGLPSGFSPNMEKIQTFLNRRAAQKNGFTTSRLETDRPEIVSGLYEGKTTGTPMTVLFENRNQHPLDYDFLSDTPRPGHADYPARMHSHGYEDLRGGGFHSGRLTLPYAFVGSLALQMLEEKKIRVGAHLQRLGGVSDDAVDALHPDWNRIDACHQAILPVLNPEIAKEMEKQIQRAAEQGDSVGAVVECVAEGLPVGLGMPYFESLESLLSSALFSIPAVKAVEFGAGFACADMPGSQFNDPYRYEGERLVTTKNDNGGFLGGMSNGMPLLFRVAVRPTPSIAKPQQSVSYARKEPEELILQGRHDPCCALRTVPVIEAAAAVTILDLMLAQGFLSTAWDA